MLFILILIFNVYEDRSFVIAPFLKKASPYTLRNMSLTASFMPRLKRIRNSCFDDSSIKLLFAPRLLELEE
jgi:hypothetical protein